MMKTELNFQDADTFYDQLLNAHEGLSAEQSEQLKTIKEQLKNNRIKNLLQRNAFIYNKQP